MIEKKLRHNEFVVVQNSRRDDDKVKKEKLEAAGHIAHTIMNKEK